MKTPLTILPILLIDVDGGIFNNDLRKEKYKELFINYSKVQASGPDVSTYSRQEISRMWEAYAKDCRMDTINPHIKMLIDVYRASIPNLEVWFMCDRVDEYLDYTVNSLKELGYLSDTCKGMITSRTGNMKYWTDGRIKEYFLYTCLINKGFLPLLAVDDRDDTVAMYQSHGIPVFKSYNLVGEGSTKYTSKPVVLRDTDLRS